MESIDQMFEDAPPPSTSGMSLDEVIREFIRLDTQIKGLAGERAAYNSHLQQIAFDTRNGQATVHLESSDGARVKCEFKKGYVCDQVELECAKEVLGDEVFASLFKIEYTPKAKNLKSFLNTKSASERTETAKDIIREAVKEVEKTPWVSVEKKS